MVRIIEREAERDGKNKEKNEPREGQTDILRKQEERRMKQGRLPRTNSAWAMTPSPASEPV